MRLGVSRLALADFEHDGQEQRLRAHAVACELALHALVGDALVRRVHVDDDEPVAILGEHVDAGELAKCVAERRNLAILDARRDAGLATVQARVERQISPRSPGQRRADCRAVGRAEIQRALARERADGRARESARRVRLRAARAALPPASQPPWRASGFDGRASAASTVRNTKSCTRRESRNRISSFAGCAFTSTRLGSSERNSTYGRLARLKQHVGIAEPDRVTQQLVADEASVDERELQVRLRARERRRREPARDPHALDLALEIARMLEKFLRRRARRCAPPAASRSRAFGRRQSWRRLCLSANSTSKRASARFLATSSRWPNSVRSVRRNFRRAGVLKNRSRTSTVVPSGCAAGRGSPSSPPSAAMLVAVSSPAVREVSLSRATDAMLGSASPRNPSVRERLEILEACDLARRMTRQRERELLTLDADAVVGHANQSRAAGLDLEIDPRRAGVERVLDELLDHGTRAARRLRRPRSDRSVGMEEPE